MSDKIYFVRVKETPYKRIGVLAERDDRSINYMANKVIEAGLSALGNSVYTEAPAEVAEALDNTRPLTAAEKVEVDAAIDSLKTGKTKLEFAPGAITVPAEQEAELPSKPGYVRNGFSPELQAKIAAAKKITQAVADRDKRERDPFGINDSSMGPFAPGM